MCSSVRLRVARRWRRSQAASQATTLREPIHTAINPRGLHSNTVDLTETPLPPKSSFCSVVAKDGKAAMYRKGVSIPDERLNKGHLCYKRLVACVWGDYVQPIYIPIYILFTA